MDIIKGLFPLLFAMIYFFLLINLLIFGRKNKNSAPAILLATLLLVSQLSEFVICFFDKDIQWLLLATIAGIWIAPLFVVIFILNITGLSKLNKGFYALIGFFFVTISTNFGSISSSCSLLALGLDYPSQWLFSYLSFIFLIISAVRLNLSIKNISDTLEIRNRRIVLYSIIFTLFVSLISALLTGQATMFLESVLAKSFLFVGFGISFYIIREKYNSEQK